MNDIKFLIYLQIEIENIKNSQTHYKKKKRCEFLSELINENIEKYKIENPNDEFPF